MSLYPLTEPYARGSLDVGEGNSIAWEVAGAPNGKPAVALHGGPGQGSAPSMRRGFNPGKYRVVLFDQRGCGGSVPHASEPLTDMRFNTTAYLVRDIDALRRHLGIDRWLVSGGSWGATLALAYAQRFPEHVSEMVLSNVTTSRRAEIHWLYEGVARFFPEAWERFRTHVASEPAADAIITAYAALMEHEDLGVRSGAARAWCAWEDAVLSFEARAAGTQATDMHTRDMLAFVRICAHFLRHHLWLEDAVSIPDVQRLKGIPVVLIHGRRDMSCPVETAWALARAWPGAELVVVEDAGHLRSEAKRAALVRALDSFANA